MAPPRVFTGPELAVRYKAGPIAVGPSVSDEVTLIDQTIPGGLMTTTSQVRCSLIGDWLNNHASGARQYTIRLYTGGTKIYDGAGSTLAVSANRRPFFCEMAFVNRGSLSSNRMSGHCGVGGIALPTTGFGLPTSSGTGNSIQGAISSDIVEINTAVAWAFKVTMQLSASETTLDMRISQILLEVL